MCASLLRPRSGRNALDVSVLRVKSEVRASDEKENAGKTELAFAFAVVFVSC
jgi:hypothetical protein